MSRIKGKDTKPEMIVRQFLFSKGYRYRLHLHDLPGKPDLVLKKYKTIIDIRGCFWHLHENCKYGDGVETPSIKIAGRRNSAVARDVVNVKRWHEAGWKVIIIWADCELEPRRKYSVKREETLNELLKALKIENTSN